MYAFFKFLNSLKNIKKCVCTDKDNTDELDNHIGSDLDLKTNQESFSQMHPDFEGILHVSIFNF